MVPIKKKVLFYNGSFKEKVLGSMVLQSPAKKEPQGFALLALQASGHEWLSKLWEFPKLRGTLGFL